MAPFDEDSGAEQFGRRIGEFQAVTGLWVGGKDPGDGGGERVIY